MRIDVSLGGSEGKRAEIDGARLRAAEQLRSESATLVFTPDRLAVVKGGPAVRRAYFDRSTGRLFPSRSPISTDYAAVLAQRNAALKRADRSALRPWTEQLAALGTALTEARAETVALLDPLFARATEALGLAAGRLSYEGDPPTVESLEGRLDRDLERGWTGLGPHLHDVAIRSADRDLRVFGSQGEQRTAVLGLLLAESALIEERRGDPPLLLLDDVLSELDPARRHTLVDLVRPRGQTLITATTADTLPGDPDQLVEVSPGEVRWSG